MRFPAEMPDLQLRRKMYSTPNPIALTVHAGFAPDHSRERHFPSAFLGAWKAAAPTDRKTRIVLISHST